MEDHLDTWMQAVAFFSSTDPVLLSIQDGVAVLIRQNDPCADLEKGISAGANQISLQPGDLQQLLQEALQDRSHVVEEEDVECKSKKGPRARNVFHLTDSAQLHIYNSAKD